MEKINNGAKNAKILTFADEGQLAQFCAYAAHRIQSGVIELYGEPGAGKSTLVRHWLRALGYRGNVPSPTYTLLEDYEVGTKRIVHADLYRIVDPEELEFLDVRTWRDRADLIFIEWPQNGHGFLPAADWRFDLIQEIQQGSEVHCLRCHCFSEGRRKLRQC